MAATTADSAALQDLAKLCAAAASINAVIAAFPKIQTAAIATSDAASKTLAALGG